MTEILKPLFLRILFLSSIQKYCCRMIWSTDGVLRNDEETLKELLALVTRGERTREAKIGSCQTAKEVRGTGSWQCPKAEVRGRSCGRGGSEWKGEKDWAQGQKAAAHTSSSGAVYKDGEGGSAGLTAWVQVQTPRWEPVPPPLLFAFTQESKAGTRFRMKCWQWLRKN